MKKHGGKRSNAGRKPIGDKKKTVPIYPQQSRIDLIGLERLKEIAIKAVEREYKKLSKK